MLGPCLRFLPFARRGQETCRAPGHLQMWATPGHSLGHSCWGARRRASPHRGSHTAVRAPGRAGVHPSQFPRCPRQRAKRQIQWGAMLPTDPALRATVGHPGGPRGDRMRQGGMSHRLTWSRTQGGRVVPHSTARQLRTQPRVSRRWLCVTRAMGCQTAARPSAPRAPTPGLVAPFEAEAQGPGVGGPILKS